MYCFNTFPYNKSICLKYYKKNEPAKQKYVRYILQCSKSSLCPKTKIRSSYLNAGTLKYFLNLKTARLSWLILLEGEKLHLIKNLTKIRRSLIFNQRWREPRKISIYTIQRWQESMIYAYESKGFRYHIKLIKSKKMNELGVDPCDWSSHIIWLSPLW